MSINDHFLIKIFSDHGHAHAHAHDHTSNGLAEEAPSAGGYYAYNYDQAFAQNYYQK